MVITVSLRTGKRRKSTDPPRSTKPVRNPSVLPNGTVESRLNKKRHNCATEGIDSLPSISFKSVVANLSNRHSSVLSGSDKTTDPYEVAVKACQEGDDRAGSNTQTINTNLASMKRMRLGRPDDRCLPGSVRSSPLPRTVFNQPSPGASFSPLTINCIRPLSVLTDFSSSSASVASCSSINRSKLTSRAAALPPIPVGKSSHKGSDLQMDVTRSEITPHAERRTRSPLYKTRKSCRLYADHASLCSVVCSSKDDQPQPTPVTTLRSVACSTLATRPVDQRSTVGVNTVFERCKGTITEPDMLGPCEPETTICLNGIVWLEITMVSAKTCSILNEPIRFHVTVII
ncbi:hypothetical protein AHF37_02547 [Paragonimus kellicotti]|nr:hypothetical protein AHF37_02547 [Paragonimus kellicotti]